MPIVIPRSGPIPESIKDTYTQEQKDKLWELIFSMNAEKILKDYQEKTRPRSSVG